MLKKAQSGIYLSQETNFKFTEIGKPEKTSVKLNPQ
jgi:hypothetical protein